jgi:hypothetical protein
MAFAVATLFLTVVVPMAALPVSAQGEDGTVAVTSPTNGQSVTYYTSSTPLTVSCSTSKTPQVDPEFGGAGMAFAIRQAGVGGFNFAQGWDSTSPYSVTRTMAQWGIANSGSHELRCRIYNGGVYYWATRTFNIVIATSGEDGSVTTTSPTSGQSVTYYTSNTPLTISCSTTHTPQVDPEFGGAGMAFAVRQAGVGGFDFNQGWDSTSPYSVTRTMAQWGIANSGNHEARCRVYENGLYYWATRTFNIVIATSGEDGSVTMTSPSNGQSISGSPLSITCTTTHTPQVDPESGGAGLVFAVRQAGVGGFNFAQGYDGSAPYMVTHTYAQWGMTGPGSYEARCRVYENGLYYWSTGTFSVTNSAAPSGCTFTTTTDGLAVTATASACQDPYGNPVSFAWDWGDGATGSGGTASHTYGAAYCPSGSPTITLTATSVGSSGTAQAVAIADKDADHDGLVACRETAQGTTDNNNDQDFDKDGISDLFESANLDEVRGAGTRNGIYCNAAATTCAYPNPVEKDLYIELDWMQGHPLRAADRTDIVNAWNAAPVNSNAGTADDIHFHLDDGALGGGTQVGLDNLLTSADWEAAYTADFANARHGVFHWGLIACNYSDDGANVHANLWGIGRAPGSRFVFFDCQPNMGDAHAQAKEFVHESGHNMLGSRIDTVACAGQADGAGGLINDHNNLGVAYFTSPRIDPVTRMPVDCNGDRNADIWDHPIDRNDAMNQNGPTGKDVTTYSANSWGALKLDWSINGSVAGADAGCQPYTARQAVDWYSPVKSPDPLAGILEQIVVPDAIAGLAGGGCAEDGLPLGP